MFRFVSHRTRSPRHDRQLRPRVLQLELVEGQTMLSTGVRKRNYQLNCEVLGSRQLLSGFYILNAASGKVLDDPNFSTSNGAQIIQFQLNGGLNQQWKLLPA